VWSGAQDGETFHSRNGHLRSQRHVVVLPVHRASQLELCVPAPLQTGELRAFRGLFARRGHRRPYFPIGMCNAQPQ
jgi:hypothetical protein